jgi:hypothetical protein
MQGSAAYAVEEIYISGSGISPFPDNPCSTEITSTPTPFIATDAPTNTVAPTYTASNTPTISPTPTATPVCPIPDYVGGFLDFYQNFDGVCPTGFDTLIPSGTVTSAASEGGGYGLRSVTFAPGEQFARADIIYPAGIHQYLVSFWVRDTGASSVQVVYQSGSPGAYTTFYTDNFGDVSGTFTNKLSFPFGGAGTTSARRIVVQCITSGGATCDIDTITYRTYDVDGWTPTIYPTSTLTPSNTTTATATFTSTNTTTPLPSVTAIATGSPAPTTTGTRTRVPIGIFTAPPLGTLPPPLTAWATSTMNLTTTAEWLGTVTPGADGTLVYVPWDSTGGDGGGGPGDTATNLGEIGRAVLGFGSNAMNQAFGFATSLGSQVSGVVTAWNTAQPVAIQGLPNCIGSARLESELCAIYYILTYTIFSGTIGSILIPLATVIVGLVLIMIVIKRARATVARIGEINKT